jgi:DNA-binding response OmpR family regulator
MSNHKIKIQITQLFFLTTARIRFETIGNSKEAGANDYIKNHLSFDELLEGSKFILETQKEHEILTLGTIEVFTAKHTVLVNKNEVTLT